jgi:hypothetical protein
MALELRAHFTGFGKPSQTPIGWRNHEAHISMKKTKTLELGGKVYTDTQHTIQFDVDDANLNILLDMTLREFDYNRPLTITIQIEQEVEPD